MAQQFDKLGCFYQRLSCMATGGCALGQKGGSAPFLECPRVFATGKGLVVSRSFGDVMLGCFFASKVKMAS